jgi:hypothetical protein
VYTVVIGLDGKITCECRIQDGTECWTVGSVEEGVDRLIRAAPNLNGVRITAADVDVVREQEVLVSTIQRVPVGRVNRRGCGG